MVRFSLAATARSRHTGTQPALASHTARESRRHEDGSAMSTWFPPDDEPQQQYNPQQYGAQQQPRQYDPVEGSSVFQPLDEGDYSERYGHIGDLPAATPLQRIASLLIDMVIVFI